MTFPSASGVKRVGNKSFSSSLMGRLDLLKVTLVLATSAIAAGDPGMKLCRNYWREENVLKINDYRK